MTANPAGHVARPLTGTQEFVSGNGRSRMPFGATIGGGRVGRLPEATLAL